MTELSVTVVGGSGYVGGELLRLLLSHPFIGSIQVTSESHYGKSIACVHPNLRGSREIIFSNLCEIKKSDVLFLALPHGKSMEQIDFFKTISPKIIDLSADFRLKSSDDYGKWYGIEHSKPDMLSEFVYGIPELHREEIKRACYVSGAGCNATAVILSLLPFFKNSLAETDKTVVEAKVGSSEGGSDFSAATHHPVRSRSVRSYKPTCHRHTAEMLQELSFGKDIRIHFSATSIEMVRGVLTTAHIFLEKEINEKDIWQLYREQYSNEPFIRIIKEPSGLYRYPEPKLLQGTNFCDIGFEKDPCSNRVVVIAAIDNLMKGSAGQAVQSLNVMFGFKETSGLDFAGLHPV